MKLQDKTEIGLIALLTGIAAVIVPFMPDKLKLPYLVVALTLIFLVQSLIRDLWILSSQKKKADRSTEQRCICLESVLGMAPIAIAGICVATGFMPAVPVAPWVWPVSVGALLTGGFLVKDYVLDLRSFRVWREKNHINVIFKWNPK